MGCHVQRGPAVIALGIDDVAAILGLQHEAGDAGTAVHGSIMQSCEASDEILHCGVRWRSQRRKNSLKDKHMTKPKKKDDIYMH